MNAYVVDVDVQTYMDIQKSYLETIKVIEQLKSLYSSNVLTEDLKSYYNQLVGDSIETRLIETCNDLEKLGNSIYNAIWMFASVDSDLFDELNKIIDDNFGKGDGITDIEAHDFINEHNPWMSPVRTGNPEIDRSPPAVLLYNGKLVAHNSTIFMHPGETIIIDVWVPPQYGDDPMIFRINSDGAHTDEQGYYWGDYLSAEALIDGTPARLFVDYDSSKYDKNSEEYALAYERQKDNAVPVSSFQWCINAPEHRSNGAVNLCSNATRGVAENGVSVSQTVEFYVDGDKNNVVKTMVSVRIYIIQEGKIPPDDVCSPDERYVYGKNKFEKRPNNTELRSDGYEPNNSLYW